MNILKDFSFLIAQKLKNINYVKKGNLYVNNLNENYGIISFQKSRESKNEFLKFTINFGVYSETLGKFISKRDDVFKNEFENYQWHSRIGQFMIDKPDYWWIIRDTDDINSAVNNIYSELLTYVIPEINKRLTNEGLINCWLYDNYAGTSAYGRFKYLTILLKSKGNIKELNNLIHSFLLEVKGKPDEKLALEHLKELECN